MMRLATTKMIHHLSMQNVCKPTPSVQKLTVSMMELIAKSMSGWIFKHSSISLPCDFCYTTGVDVIL